MDDLEFQHQTSNNVQIILFICAFVS